MPATAAKLAAIPGSRPCLMSERERRTFAFGSEMKETANKGGPNFLKLRMTSNALLVRKLVGENFNPVNFRRFSKEVARLDFFHQSRRHFAI